MLRTRGAVSPAKEPKEVAVEAVRDVAQDIAPETMLDDAAEFVRHAESLLASLMRHDEGTRLHCGSVASWSRRIAAHLGMAARDVTFIERCALLHDVGKILTPQAILAKPGPLTDAEWHQMREHAADGAALLNEVPELRPYAHVVRSHHEFFNGRGYPSGLAGDAIPLAARIVSVADCLDAMISDRSYRKPLTPAAALAELVRCSGTQFDGHVVDCVLAITRVRYPYIRQAAANE
ncbi:MAG: hypothetical protein PVSMB8_14530 [Vulcanimicrobiaceae bacterium]